jgi:hypothetical protein
MDWKADEGRLNRHVLLHIGDLPIAEVRARHLVDMFHKLRTDPNLNLAPRSIYNIYSVVSAVFRDASSPSHRLRAPATKRTESPKRPTTTRLRKSGR